GRGKAETCPYQEIAAEEDPGLRRWTSPRLLLALDCREQQDHGAALGTIMAIIMTHHMANMSAASKADHGIGSISMPDMLMSIPAPAAR
ncbi:MAG TPA: hypothetical protein VNZ53_47735, partial [Steroidobacteraceae bacterium]|nr:hypothetical protein [Steroidobacteraceae bacterium]